MIRDNNYRYIICSDGSTLKVDQESCGKSGAAAVIYDNNLLNDPVMLKRDLGTQSNNYVAELVGINIGLKYLESCIETGSALFLVDCLPALNSSFSSKIGKTYTNEVAQNVLLTRQLLEKGWEIEATWMPGHEGFQANELADKLAKEVAGTAKNPHYPCDRRIILNQLRERVINNWQFRYQLNCFGHQVYGICDKVDKWFNPNIPGIRSLFQLVSGHTKLNTSQVRYNPLVTDDKCSCGMRETPDNNNNNMLP